jgi:predicted nuclease of predicted toxin-antitoxin system
VLKFLVDEDLPRSTVRLLKEMGFIALDVRDCGLRGKTDEEIFEYAQREKAIIFTADRGIGSTLRFPLGTHCGIVVAHFPNELSTADLNVQIQKALNKLKEDDLINNLVIIEPKKIRIRRYTDTTLNL